jgi:DNA-binding CsgD family transcriptional regulator
MEVPSQNKGCHEYENISLSDYKTVRTLIKYRQYIYPIDKQSQSFNFKELLTCIYIDLDRLIKDAPLSNSERLVIELYMRGYTTQDIMECKNVNETTVVNLLTRASRKISNLHNERWMLVTQRMLTKYGQL